MLIFMLIYIIYYIIQYYLIIKKYLDKDKYKAYILLIHQILFYKILLNH